MLVSLFSAYQALPSKRFSASTLFKYSGTKFSALVPELFLYREIMRQCNIAAYWNYCLLKHQCRVRPLSSRGSPGCTSSASECRIIVVRTVPKIRIGTDWSGKSVPRTGPKIITTDQTHYGPAVRTSLINMQIKKLGIMMLGMDFIYNNIRLL